jgi:predicted Zn finger-like uncharacterized protein
MDVRCEKCRTEYEVDEALIKPGGTAVRCTNCGLIFKIRRPPQRKGPPPPPPAKRRNDDPAWWVRLENGEKRLCSGAAELQQWIAAGEVHRQSLISKSGDVWTSLGGIPELAQLFERADELRDQERLAAEALPAPEKPRVESPADEDHHLPSEPVVQTSEPDAHGSIRNDVNVGRLIEQYRIVKLLGKGGMGAVYLGVHDILKTRVAVKFMSRDLIHRYDSIEAFRREATSAVRIEHPNVVRVLSVGVAEPCDPYLIMEYLEGETLQLRLGRGPLSASEARAIFSRVADAVQAVHQANVIHRDIKPQNIMVNDRGGTLRVTLLDFGLAKVAKNDAGELSTTNAEQGTMNFMAPEQLGTKVTFGADVWGFAATIYYALTRSSLFDVGDDDHIVIALKQRTPIPLGVRKPNADRDLERALEACFARSPSERPPTIAAAWEAIDRGLAQQQIIEANDPTSSLRGGDIRDAMAVLARDLAGPGQRPTDRNGNLDVTQPARGQEVSEPVRRVVRYVGFAIVIAAITKLIVTMA